VIQESHILEDILSRYNHLRLSAFSASSGEAGTDRRPTQE